MLITTGNQTTATRGVAEGSEHAPSAAPGAAQPARSGGLSLTEGMALSRSLGTLVLNGPVWTPRSKADAAFQVECPEADGEMDWESDPYYPMTFRLRTIAIRCDEAKRRAVAFGEGATARRSSVESEGEDTDGGKGVGGHIFAGPETPPTPSFCGSCLRFVYSDDEVWAYGEPWHEACLERLERDMEKELRGPRRRR